MRRRGALTQESLEAALATEQGQGFEPDRLAVGDGATQVVADRIIRDSSRGVLVLAAVVPVVELDFELEPGEWELRRG